MMQQVPSSTSKLDKAMSPEQFNQIVEAILAGKYSWACVLILRFAGYNPLHYIPYRTYNRLLKENCQIGKPRKDKTDRINTTKQSSVPASARSASQKHLSRISDLDYLEGIDSKKAPIRGGFLEQWQGLKNPCFNALNLQFWRAESTRNSALN